MVTSVMSSKQFTIIFVFAILCGSGVWSYAASASKIAPPTPSATHAALERGSAIFIHPGAATGTLGAEIALTPGDVIETGPEGRVLIEMHGATMLLLDTDSRLVTLLDESFLWPRSRSHTVLALERGRAAWYSADSGPAHVHALETATTRISSASSTAALLVVRADRTTTRVLRPDGSKDDSFSEEARVAVTQFQQKNKSILRDALNAARTHPGAPTHWLQRLGELIRVAATSDRATRIAFRHALIERRFFEWLNSRERGSARAQERAQRELELEKTRFLKEADGLSEASRDVERRTLAAWERDDVPYALALLGITESSNNLSQTSGIIIEPYDNIRRYIPPPIFIAPIMTSSTVVTSTPDSPPLEKGE